MDEKEGSTSPSPDDLERPSRRRKLDSSNSSNVDTSGNDSVLDSEQDSELMKQEFKVLRGKLYQTEANAIEYHKIRIQTEELFEKKRNLLELRVKFNKEKIVKLQEDLKTSMRGAQESQEAQAAAHAKLSQLKTIIEQEITPLIMASSSGNTAAAAALQVQENREPAEEKIIEMEKTLDNDSTSQKELSPEDIPLKRAKRVRKSLKAKAKRADKLEEELRVAGDTISSLHEAIGKKASSIEAKLAEVEILQQQVKMLQNAPDHNDDSVMPEDEEQGKHDSRLLIGKKYLASAPQFIDINWDEEFTNEKKGKWVCITCSYELKTKQRMQDHVWTAHYKGKFQCPVCTDPPTFTPWRANLITHMRKKHPHWGP